MTSFSFNQNSNRLIQVEELHDIRYGYRANQDVIIVQDDNLDLRNVTNYSVLNELE